MLNGRDHNNVDFQPTISANIKGLETTLSASETRLCAASPQTAILAHTICK
jgi:hypothetical protein